MSSAGIFVSMSERVLNRKSANKMERKRRRVRKSFFYRAEKEKFLLESDQRKKMSHPVGQVF
jgi:hypothetical protein